MRRYLFTASASSFGAFCCERPRCGPQFVGKNYTTFPGSTSYEGTYAVDDSSRPLMPSARNKKCSFANSRGLGTSPHHQIVEQCVLPDGTLCREHTFRVPVCHDRTPSKKTTETRTIQIFVRELVSPENKDNADTPFVLYLQGGPGFPSSRPTAPAR